MNGTAHDRGAIRYAREDAKHEFFAGIVTRCADVLVAAVGEPSVEAVFMTGAPARGEATVVETSSGLFSLSDVDLVCVAAEGADIAAAQDAAATAVARLNEELASVCVGVDASVKPLAREVGLPAYIANYEFARTPVLLFGEPDAARALGSVDIERIPASDALRFVHNRCVERLIAERAAETQHGAANDEELAELRALYATAKLMLDLVTAFLFARRDVPVRYADRVRLFVEGYCERPEHGVLASEIAPFLDELGLWADFKISGDAAALRRGLPPETLAGASIAPFAFAMWRQVLGDVVGEDLTRASLPPAIDRLAALESPARSLVRSLKALRAASGEVFSAGSVLRGALHASPVTRSYIVALILLLTGFGRDDEGGAGDADAGPPTGAAVRTPPRQWTKAALRRYAPFDVPGGFGSLPDGEVRALLADRLALFHERILLGRIPSGADDTREARTP